MKESSVSPHRSEQEFGPTACNGKWVGLRISAIRIRLISHPDNGLGAGWVALSAGSFEDGIATLGKGVERGGLASEALGGGAEEGEAGDELESVGAATHQVFERTAAGELLADAAGDFFVAGAEERVAQVLAGFRQIADRVGAGGGGTAEAFELREDVPDPVAGFAPQANLRERGVVAGGEAGLGDVKAVEAPATADSSFGEHRGIRERCVPKFNSSVAGQPLEARG